MLANASPTCLYAYQAHSKLCCMVSTPCWTAVRGAVVHHHSVVCCSKRCTLAAHLLDPHACHALAFGAMHTRRRVGIHHRMSYLSIAHTVGALLRIRQSVYIEWHAGLQNDVFKGLPAMALTATATSKVIDDVIKSLKIPRCRRFQVRCCMTASCSYACPAICCATKLCHRFMSQCGVSGLRDSSRLSIAPCAVQCNLCQTQIPARSMWAVKVWQLCCCCKQPIVVVTFTLHTRGFVASHCLHCMEHSM